MAVTKLQPPPFRTPMLDPNGLVSATGLWGNFFVNQAGLIINAAPVDGTYLVATGDSSLTNEINLGALASGYLQITVAAGIATVASSASINASGLTGTLPDAVFPATLPAVNGSLLTHLTGQNVDHSVVTKAFADTGYVAVADQTVLVNATAGATTIKLPATPTSGASVTVKKTDASGNAVTVDGNSHTMDGAGTSALPAQWNALTVIADGANWFITAVV